MDAPRNWRIYNARANCIHVNPLRGKCQRSRPGEADHPRFSSSIRCLIWSTGTTRDGRDIDNMAAGLHMSCGILHSKKDRLKVQSEDGVPFIFCNFKIWMCKYSTCIINQYGQWSPFGSANDYFLNIFQLSEIRR